eukprot:CAMPEP_0201507922 /NCGR_PEP_ID=MMETSP0161_2-20130828/1431_1 /ASSEMBLY_ACC=CAM_ASM_000251 /TAXON_ID=180227 /ORGANISM="Neoparamoeba aestuarina, Strain SoJaBio B1-5/56/2" /LENGTH=76 /DNA_ID=CAMNT_0047902417 /DNA_START=150 /DNA_END=377 /DNA_ORIENTATION=-
MNAPKQVLCVFIVFLLSLLGDSEEHQPPDFTLTGESTEDKRQQRREEIEEREEIREERREEIQERREEIQERREEI